jgi:hypothetical protein
VRSASKVTHDDSDVTVDQGLLYTAADPNAEDGRKERPFTIKVNLQKAYSNREFHIQYVPQASITNGRGTVRHRPAVHIKMKVPLKDVNSWEARLESIGSNVILVEGPAECAWDREIDEYHKALPKPCEDTKREHEKTHAKAAQETLHYRLVFPPHMKIDNFLYSADYTKMDAFRFGVKKNSLSTGIVAWNAAFDIMEDVTSKTNDDKIDIEDLMRQFSLNG